MYTANPRREQRKNSPLYFASSKTSLRLLYLNRWNCTRKVRIPFPANMFQFKLSRLSIRARPGISSDSDWIQYSNTKQRVHTPTQRKKLPDEHSHGFFKVAEIEGTRQLGTFHSILMRGGLEYQTVIILKHFFSSFRFSFIHLLKWVFRITHTIVFVSRFHMSVRYYRSTYHQCLFSEKRYVSFTIKLSFFPLVWTLEVLFHCAKLWILFSHLQLLCFMIVITFVTFKVNPSFSHIQDKSPWKANNTF